MRQVQEYHVHQDPRKFTDLRDYLAELVRITLDGVASRGMESEASHPGFATVVPQPGGWVFVKVFGTVGTACPPVAVLLKTVERDGRRVITALVVVAERVSSTVVKALPLGRIESLLNTPRTREAIEAADPREGTLDALLEAEIEWLDGEPDFARRLRLDPERRPLVAPTKRREPLRRPDRSDPEGFYRRVADAYNETLAKTSAPATVLAAEAGVPVPTARRWIAEARRRGLLPPGRQGRAG